MELGDVKKDYVIFLVGLMLSIPYSKKIFFVIDHSSRFHHFGSRMAKEATEQ